MALFVELAAEEIKVFISNIREIPIEAYEATFGAKVQYIILANTPNKKITMRKPSILLMIFSIKMNNNKFVLK